MDNRFAEGVGQALGLRRPLRPPSSGAGWEPAAAWEAAPQRVFKRCAGLRAKIGMAAAPEPEAIELALKQILELV